MRGHIQKRGDAWRVYVNLGRDANGKRRMATETVHGNRTDAEQALSRLLVESDEGRRSVVVGSVADLAERWYEVASPRWAPNTRYTQRGALDRYILPTLGPVQLRKLRTADIDRLYAAMGRRKLGPATVRRAHVVVHRMLDQAVRWGELGVNPAANASPPPVPRKEVASPDADDVKALIARASESDPEFACFLRLAAVSGGRRSELCALTWADIDVARGQVAITKALSVTGPVDGTTKSTKTGSGRRVAVDEVTMATLVAHRDAMAARAAKVGAALGPWVFSADPASRLPWHPSSVTHRFVRLARAAKVDAHLHSLRHFSASTLLDAGVPAVSASHRLGHSRTSTTTDIYGHFVPDRDRSAADAVGRALG